LRAALFEVAAVFAAADFSSVVNVMVKQRSIYLPAGDGVFAGDVVRGRIEKTDKVLWYCRPRTYFTAAMMASHHRPIAAASSPDRSVAAAVLQIAFPNVGERKCA
jgi:hypothetical protein